MNPSVFTQVLAGTIPGEVIFRDDTVAVLLTIEPFSSGHMLVIPIEQVDHIWDVPVETYHHMWDVARDMADKLRQRYDYERIGIVVEGYGVPHAHIHVFGYDKPLQPMVIEHARSGRLATAEELAAEAAKLRK